MLRFLSHYTFLPISSITCVVVCSKWVASFNMTKQHLNSSSLHVVVQKDALVRIYVSYSNKTSWPKLSSLTNIVSNNGQVILLCLMLYYYSGRGEAKNGAHSQEEERAFTLNHHASAGKISSNSNDLQIFNFAHWRSVSSIQLFPFFTFGRVLFEAFNNCSCTSSSRLKISMRTNGFLY